MVRMIALLLAASFGLAQDSFKAVQSRVAEFTLANGMKFIVLERHRAPVVSFYTYADVGSAQEVKGITGVAHMFEHMAFKGNKVVGTKNYAEEKLALDRVDEAWFAFARERAKGDRADRTALKKLEEEFRLRQESAGKFIVADEFGKLIEQAGGRDLNASTAPDRTDYFYSLPSNSIELWFSLESERFLNPVLREYYKERNVVMEERRMRTESNPIGKLVEEFLAASYKSHPYGEPTVGHMSDLQNITTRDAEEFLRKYYAASNLTVAMVGDVDVKNVRELAETYFGRLPKRPKPDPLRTVEPPQEVERRLVLRAQAQRLVLIGFHKPSASHPDDAVYDAIGNLLSGGRSSRLHKRLVTEKKVAVQAVGLPGLPGQKYPGLFLFLAVTAPGKTNEEVEKDMLAEIERLKSEPVSAEELEGVKNRVATAQIRTLGDNLGMARALATSEILLGDWRGLFTTLDRISAVTAADVQRVARTAFTDQGRTVAYLEPAAAAAAPR